MQKLVNVGDKVTLIKIEKNVKNSNVKAKTYISQVLEFISDEEVKISMPLEGSKVVPLNVGERYLLYIYTKNGNFQCKAVIVDRFREGTIFMLLIKILSSLEKHQQRRYYRLETNMDIKFRIISEEEKIMLAQKDYTYEERLVLLENSKFTWYDGIITDLSGGGIRFISSKSTDKDSQIGLILKLTIGKEEYEYDLAGNIILVKQLENRRNQYEYRVEFHKIKPEHRENIIKFIFEEERMKRRKEKGLD